jgi:hypothetical protein
LTSYFDLLISEGSVELLYCPDQDCVKTRMAWDRTHDKPADEGHAIDKREKPPGDIEEEEVNQLLGQEKMERFKKLKAKRLVENGTVTRVMAHCLF